MRVLQRNELRADSLCKLLAPLGIDSMVQSEYPGSKRCDDFTPFLSRSLEQFLNEELEVPLEPLPIVSGAVIDFNNEVSEWAKTFTSTIIDGSGVAEFYESYAQSSIPMASIRSEEFTRKVLDQALGYEFSVFDLGFESFASGNRRPIRLRDRLNRHSVRGQLELAERTFMWGDAARDVYGWANHPNVAIISRAAGVWLTASGEEIITDITNMFQAIRDNTNCTQEPNALMIPERVWTNWTRPYTSTSGPTVVTSQSIRAAVQAAFPSLTIGSLCRLQTDKSLGNLTASRAVMYRRDPEVVQAIFPMRPRFLAPQAAELMIKTPGFCRHGGTDWKQPFVGVYMDVAA